MIVNLMSAYHHHRPCLPSICRRSLWPGLGQEALAAGQDGEERDAKHGACCERENGSRGKMISENPTLKKIRLTPLPRSNNFPFGVKPVMMMYPMLLISSEC